ncbi:hypothetical protein ACFPVY_05865 [Flavobacterium qiangtangense]|uniref:Lipoprotein n=1 Tax=Flavobacterium qiangtangense TaxID=1442595 RepID=A0ABW1PM07_9FLAO
MTKKFLFLISVLLLTSCKRNNSSEITNLYVQFLPKDDFIVDISIDINENYLLYESGVGFVAPIGWKEKKTCGVEILKLQPNETKRLLTLYKAIDFQTNKDSILGMKTSIESISGNKMKQNRQFGSWSVSEKKFLKEILILLQQKGSDCLKDKTTDLDVF